MISRTVIACMYGFRDCDAMGHVNHVVYFPCLEQCRLMFWREVTGDASPHTRVIIARAECHYKTPARFGDEIEVAMKVGGVGSSLSLQYEVTDVAWALLESVRGTQGLLGSLGSDGGPDGGQTPV